MTAQTWSSEDYAKNARFVTDLGTPVLELLALFRLSGDAVCNECVSDHCDVSVKHSTPKGYQGLAALSEAVDAPWP